MRNNESGRSMVEMLGVLAVIGVLSIGGIAGYMMAMNRHHSNNVLEGVSARAVIISTQKMMDQPAAQPADMAEEIDDYAVAVVEEPGVCAECFGIEVSGIPQGVCRYILNQKWTTPAGVYLNDDEYPTEDGTNCNETDNVIEFVFSPSMGDESHTCGYCQHDENGTCVADETCDNECPGDKPIKDVNGNCKACSNGSKTYAVHTDAAECAKCPDNFRSTSGWCPSCSSPDTWSADAIECARCPEREIVNGNKCVLKECPDGYLKPTWECISCDYINALTLKNATECAKCPNRYIGNSGQCYSCDHSDPEVASETECTKCSNRFRGTRGYCYICSTSSAPTADASECAKCSNRKMTDDGKCVLK